MKYLWHLEWNGTLCLLFQIVTNYSKPVRGVQFLVTNNRFSMFKFWKLLFNCTIWLEKTPKYFKSYFHLWSNGYRNMNV